jgi:hypothetical protein
MNARWAFLQPWLDALQAVLVRPGDAPQPQDQQRFVCATFGSWPSQRVVDAVVAEGTLDVEFPADQATRQDSDSPQQIREAVTIFDTLAAVDNAAFVAALSGYMQFHQLKHHLSLLGASCLEVLQTRGSTRPGLVVLWKDCNAGNRPCGQSPQQ